MSVTDQDARQNNRPNGRLDPFAPPELPHSRQLVYEYYRLARGPDGCPMKRMPDGRLVFHPILIPYLVVDYLNLHKNTGDETCLDYAVFVMERALERADAGRDEIIFTYDPQDGLSSIPHAFFSALTQSWYVSALAKLERIFPGKYGESLRRAFLSLLIPIEEGGVLLKKDFGWIVEEYPNEPPLYTLNGWLTALRMVLDSHDILARNGVECQSFLERNLDAVEHLLPLYDADFCWNSRYQLTGFTRIKFVTDRSVKMECLSMMTNIAGEQPIYADLNPPLKRNRWRSYLERHESRMLQFNILQSMISFPKANDYRLRIRCNRDCNMRVFVADGDYDPGLSALPTKRWREISRTGVVAGDNEISGEIPYDDRNVFAYPTNFKKQIGDLYYNAYHIVHIVDLAVLYRYTGRTAFADTARKWLGYMENWEGMPELASPVISKMAHLYGDTLQDTVKKYLSKSLKCI